MITFCWLSVGAAESSVDTGYDASSSLSTSSLLMRENVSCRNRRRWFQYGKSSILLVNCSLPVATSAGGCVRLPLTQWLRTLTKFLYQYYAELKQVQDCKLSDDVSYEQRKQNLVAIIWAEETKSRRHQGFDICLFEFAQISLWSYASPCHLRDTDWWCSAQPHEQSS
jgi:hypothetical protein